MRRQQKLLLSCMVGGLMLFYGIAALTSPEIAKTALGSTVHLGIFDAQVNLLARGSGFFVGPNQIATNYHVIEAILNEGAIGGAKLVGKEEIYAIEKIVAHSKNHDLAIVKVKGVKIIGINVPALPLGDSDAVQIGDKVYVAGNPKGLEGTFSDGIISAIRPGGVPPLVRGKILQMTAPVSPGSSGGPVLNDGGEVIGISALGSIRGDAQNLNFAIPVNYLKVIMPTTPTPVKPKQVKPKVDPPPVESQPAKPQVDSPPVEPKPALTPQEIRKIANGSTVLLGIRDAYGNLIGYGSGFVVAPHQIATNYHVVENISRVFAKLVGKGKWYDVGLILADDKEHDLAVVKVTGIDVPALPLGDSDTVKIGETIYVAGNPSGPGGRAMEGTVTIGTIRNIRTEDILMGDKPLRGKKLQIDASIEPGSSGGPVLNDNGEVIGISVGGYPGVGVEEYVPQGYNYAIAVNHLKPLVTLPITPPPVESEQVTTEAPPPQLEPPKPPPRHDMLEKGIKLYEQARYNEAIEALSSAVRELEDPEQRARAYLYLGASKRGSGEGNDKVKEQFQESIRHNPNQKLPPRVGKDHPIFAELLEEVRKELTGELTVISLLPQTEIWIFGTRTDRKMLGTGIVSSRLLRGNYVVEGIYAGKSQRKTITIEPDRHEVLDLGIPPIMEHDSPSRISVGEIIPLTLNLISSKGPQQVKIYYKIYDKDRNELAQNSQEMRLWDQQSASSTWAYKVGLPSQKHVGLIEYYIEVEYDNHVVFRQPRTQNRYYQISIVDDKPPTISLLYPPEGSKFGANQQITIRAEVTDNIAVKDVHIHASSFNSQESQKLAAESSSDIYTIDIIASNIVVLWYYLTATDEEGNENRSESRHLEIKPGEKPPEIKTPIASDGNESNLEQQKNPPEEEPPEEESPEEEPPDDPPPPPPPPSTIYQGIWVSFAADDAFISGSDGSYMFRLAYVREGKNQSTLGAQLDFSHPDRTNVSAMVQWGPALGESDVAFTLLGGIAAYEDSPRSTHITPILGAGLRFYPRDKIVIDATSSIQFRQGFDTISLYHYEVGIRFYITRELGLRAGYGKLSLGDEDVTTLQIGLGYTF